MIEKIQWLIDRPVAAHLIPNFQRSRVAHNLRELHVAENGDSPALVRVHPLMVGAPRCRPTRDSLL